MSFNSDDELQKILAALPDNFTHSKDWMRGDAVERIEWLKGTVEGLRNETAMLWKWAEYGIAVHGVADVVEDMCNALGDYISTDETNAGQPGNEEFVDIQSRAVAAKERGAKLLAGLRAFGLEFSIARSLLETHAIMDGLDPADPRYVAARNDYFAAKNAYADLVHKRAVRQTAE